MCNKEIDYSEKVNLSKDIVRYIDEIEWKYGIICEDSNSEDIRTALYAEMVYTSNFGRSDVYYVYVTQGYFDSDEFNFRFSRNKEFSSDDWADDMKTVAKRAEVSPAEADDFINKVKGMMVMARSHLRYNWQPL